MFFFLLVTAFLVLISAQPAIVFCSMAILYVLYRLFWVKGQPKIIFAGLFLFWLSITVKVFYADFVGLRYEDLSISPKIIETTYLALACLLVFSLGIFVFSKNALKKIDVSYTKTFNYRIDKIIIFYIVATVGASVLFGILFFFAGFSQLFNAIIQLRTGFLFLLIYSVYAQKKGISLAIIVISIEIILSFVSFFSSFKDLLIVIGISLSYFPLKFTFKQIVRNIVIVIGCLYMMLIWQTIKGEYRAFLNGGAATQTITVTTQDALSKIYELASKADPFSKDNDVVYQSIDRLSYIEFFSQAMVRVPNELPYENGKLWTNNIVHILVPRIVYPDKPVIDDSKMVNTYCMRSVATAEQGTSISLGFLAESYIDYGPVGMLVPIFLIGCLFGFFYKYLIQKSINYVWGFTFVVPLWSYINCNGIPGTKILGWLFMYVIATYLFRKYLMTPLHVYMGGSKFTFMKSKNNLIASKAV